ncbi:MAG: PilZ domain-containing protein [Bdellovibrionota bacterium]
MSITSFSPRFIKAKISFNIGNKVFPVGEHLINATGVPGFKWTQFDPKETIGRRIKVAVQVIATPIFEFNCDAILTCESTEGGTALGLFFVLGEVETQQLNDAIAREGVLPDYVRKFPRIPFTESIPIMPSRTIMNFFSGTEEVSVACDLDNLSPSGFQVLTEDQRIKVLTPGELVRAQIQPRGNFPSSIEAISAVKRVIHGIDAKTGNQRWQLGLSIMTISNEQKILFTELLRQVVNQMRR